MNRFIPLSLFIVVIGCSSEKTIEFRLKNPSKVSRAEVLLLDVSDIQIPANQFLVLKDENGTLIPSETVDSDQNGSSESIRFEVNLKAEEQLSVMVAFSEEQFLSKKKTQAELSIKEGGEWKDRKYIGGEFRSVTQLKVPAEHTDHSNFIRYEGPGWESDKAAYRYYLDWRNGTDFFGKKTPELVLQGVGLDGFDSYHDPSDWGMDVLKVGSTLGLGSIDQYRDSTLLKFQAVDSTICQVSENGLLKSSITTTYFGWKPSAGVSTTLTSTVSVLAGSAMTTHELQLSQPITGFCSGLIVSEGEELIDKISGDYRILMTYGKFSLAGDGLGLAIAVHTKDIEQVLDDVGSHVVVFNPQKQLKYHFLATWEQDYSGVSSITEFEKLVDQEVLKLTDPIQISRSNP